MPLNNTNDISFAAEVGFEPTISTLKSSLTQPMLFKLVEPDLVRDFENKLFPDLSYIHFWRKR